MNYKKPEFKTINIKTKHFNFAVHEIGQGSRHIICIPPFPTPSIGYIYSLKHLPENDYKLTMIDIPGILGGSKVDLKYSFSDLCSEMEEVVFSVLDEGFQKPDLLAVSYGATIALNFSTKTLRRFRNTYAISPIIYKFMTRIGSVLKLFLSVKLFRSITGLVIINRYKRFIKVFFENEFSSEQLKFLKNYSSNIDYNELAIHISHLLDVNLIENLDEVSKYVKTVYFGDQENSIFKSQAKHFNEVGIKVKWIKGEHFSFMCEPNLSTKNIVN